MKTPVTHQNERPLLVTMTKEPFQPVRLYYRIPSRPAVISKLRGLECMAEDPVERCWQWLYHGETKALRSIIVRTVEEGMRGRGGLPA